MALSTFFGPVIWKASLFLILYPYFGYPLLLFLFSRGRLPKKALDGNQNTWPAVSIVISAFNEEEAIEEKILNTLELDYPREKLEIWVASDGSTDRTNERAALYQDRGVRLFWQKERQGKSALLNQVVPLTAGGILVFTDANAFFDRKSLQNLVLSFRDERIGFVTGRTEYIVSPCGNSVGKTSGLYHRFERYLKRKESALGSCVGADGAIFAIRKELYLPLLAGDLNDLAIPLQVVRQGYRGVMEESALVRECASLKMGGEVRRQIRITNRTVRTLFRNRNLLNPFRYPVFAWQLVSHKLLRLLVPFLMITLLISNLAALGSGKGYFFFLVLQLAFYSLALIGSWLGGWEGKLSLVCRVPYHFVLVNHAMLCGWLRCCTRNHDVLWTPDRMGKVNNADR
ncbi:MAG: glycosyltransferase family 2 protein [bacterium]